MDRNYYYDLLHQDEISMIFLTEEPNIIFGLLLDEGYSLINSAEISHLPRGFFEEGLISLTGYSDNGARNPNVFYELACDLRWWSGDKLAISINISQQNIDFTSRAYVLNCFTEASLRLKAEQNRRLITIIG